MECRDITDREFELIMAELGVVRRSDGATETVTGQHDLYGATVLVRDGCRCMVLVDNAASLDRFLALRAFLMNGAAAMVNGHG